MRKVAKKMKFRTVLEKSCQKDKIQNSAECFGGVARVHQRQKEIREEDPEAIFLNAGDFYQVPNTTCFFTLSDCRALPGTRS